MKMLRSLTYLTCAVSTIVCLPEVQDTPRERPADLEVETWQDFGRMASLIHALPAWDDQDDLTAAEWKTLAELALSFQSLRDQEVEAVLITYMNLYKAQDNEAHSGRTKPLLLLRMMFDTSKRTKNATDIHARQWRERGYQPMGGFDWHAIPQPAEWALDALPIAWSDSKPTLGAKRSLLPASGYTGPPVHSYQPHLDFRYLRDMYEKRDLSALAGTTKLDWRDLAKAANLFADDPRTNR